MNCETCNTKLPTLVTRRRRVNEALYTLGLTYHVGLPVQQVDEILQQNGFELPEGIYCGRDGSVREGIGDQTYISFTWHTMPSGRYEVVAYVN